MWEVGLWRQPQGIGNELFYNYYGYNQAIVVPETIDAIRALTGIEPDLWPRCQDRQALGLCARFV